MEPFSIALWMKIPKKLERAVVFHRSRAWTDAASRGYQLLIEDGKLSASLIHFWPGNAIGVRTAAEMSLNQWIHVAMVYDGSSRADGLQIFVDGKPTEQMTVRDNLYKQIQGGGGDNIAIGQRFRDKGFRDGVVDEFRVFNRQLSKIEVAELVDGGSLADAFQAGPVNAQQRARLFEYYLLTTDKSAKQNRAMLREAREKVANLSNSFQEIMIMRDLEPMRPTFLLKRGAYDAPGQPVLPEVPAAFPPLPTDLPRNRLALANWLTDPSNPLAARVAVNRFWRICFGHGLVRTPEDFGSQGAAPTHPELLDWLAADFVEHGWNVKRLMKQMVMSATYRQDSNCSQELRTSDPKNLLLARGPRYRWPAEMLRDHVLLSSGLLVDKIGGPPAKPYEVNVSFKPVQHDKGEGLYRRSLYTYWKRTAPAPVMMALDAAKRDVCSVKRERTASPLQAFVLLNDPQFVEACRVLAENVLREFPKNTQVNHRITKVFRILTGRVPNHHEREILMSLFEEQITYFNANQDRASKLLSVGDQKYDDQLDAVTVAATTIVASTVLNFDEAVMKR